MLKYEQWLLHETKITGDSHSLHMFLCIFHFIFYHGHGRYIYNWKKKLRRKKEMKEVMEEGRKD